MLISVININKWFINIKYISHIYLYVSVLNVGSLVSDHELGGIARPNWYTWIEFSFYSVDFIVYLST